MKISMELIDEMRKRTNCSYQEAKELLERNNGDLVEAIIEFETRHGSNNNEHCKHKYKHKYKAYTEGNHKQKAKTLLHKGFVTRVVIEKDENIILNLSVIILILAVLISMPIIWIWPVAFIILYFTGYKIRIRKETGGEVDINNLVDDFGNKVKNATEAKDSQPKDSNQNNESKEASSSEEVKEKDGYNEITVE
ncbi:MAG: DUF4342 domain-containing protein [Peptococcaceae bacterium]|jgi:hypothetical protein|nr:DUF4342 domain-containing protein [Peptococcaceae bacterium]